MSKEAFEGLFLEVIKFDTEDVITTSGKTPDPLSSYELPIIINN